jgi:putative flippase GtrA
MFDRLSALHAAPGVRFVIAGLTQLALDWGLFVLLTTLGAPVAVANPAARLCVVAFGFWLHGVYTFADDGKHNLGWAQLSRYAPTWIALTTAGTLALAAIESRFGLQVTWIAKPAVEAVLAVVSFFALRHWVFRAAPGDGA